MDCSSITDFQQSTAIRIAKKFRHLHIGILKSNNAANAKNGNGNDIEEENADVSGGGEDHSGDAKS